MPFVCVNLFVPDRDYDHDHVGNRAGIMLGLRWDNLGIVVGSLWDHVGIVLGSCRDNCGVVVGSCWDRFVLRINMHDGCFCRYLWSSSFCASTSYVY